ncbi:MAG: hypothetical protein NT106_06475 [Candidatus Sumerlaeota bacterium]|nr:hypothetical protein [Candidatus Sumerlaeota bacterium]
MKLKRYQKWLLRLPLYLILAAFIIAVLTYLFPISGARLNAYLADILSAQTGRRVSVDGARLYLSRGLVTVRKLSIPAPDASQPPLIFTGIRMTFPPEVIFSRSNIRLNELRMNCPMQIPLVWENGALTFRADYQYLIKLLREFSLLKNERGNIAIPRIQIVLDGIHYYGSAGFSRKANLPLLSISPAEFRLTLDEGKLSFLTIKGTLHSEIESEMEGSASFGSDGTPKQISLLVAHLLITEKTFPVKDLIVDVKNLRIGNEIHPSGQIVAVSHALSTDAFLLNVPGVAMPFRQEQIHLKASATIDLATSFLNIEQAGLQLGDSNIKFNGRLGMQGDFPFSVAIEQNPISRLTLERLKNRLLPPGIDIALQPSSLNLKMETTGTFRNLAAAQFKGQLIFASVALRHHDFPLPLTDLSGVMDIDNTNATFSGVSGKFGDGNIRLHGQIRGARDMGHPEDADLSWAADISAPDIALMLRNRLLPDNSETSGRLFTTGSLSLALTVHDGYTSATVKNFNALVDVRNGSFTHPLLPDIITSIDGRFALQPEKLEFTRLSGVMSGARFQAEGHLQGRRYFYHEPQLEMTITSGGEIPAILPLVPERFRRVLIQNETKGHISSEVHLHGPALKPEKVHFYGSATLEDFSLRPRHPLFQHRVEKVHGNVTFDAGHLYLEKLKGEYAGMPFELAGKMDGEGVQLKVQGTLELGKTFNAFPVLKEDFHASGTAEVSAEILFASPDLYDSINRVKPPENKWWGFSGVIRARDALFAYRDMPADLTHINGLITFSNREIAFEGVKLWCGKSPDCITSGKVRLDASPPDIVFEVNVPELEMEEWTLGWVSKKHVKRPTTIDDLTSTSPTIEVSGAVNADVIHYKKLTGQDFRGHFIYNYFPKAPNKLVFDHTSVSAYGGNITATGNLLFPAGPFYYGLKGETKKVSLQPFLTAMRGREETFSGFMDASLTLAGVSKNPDTIRGDATFDVTQSRMIGNVILLTLGKALHSTLLDDITFSRIRGAAEINNGGVHFRDIQFTSPIINMSINGLVDFHENADINCYLMFSKNPILSFPIIRQVRELLELLGRAIFKYRITGNLKKPHVEAVALSTDEIGKFLSGFR